MAIKSTIFKANLSIADIDHSHYADLSMVLARHPSETDERMMVRLVAMALQAHQLQTLCNGDGNMAFGAGLSDPNDPDVWLRDYTETTKLWIEVGAPEEKPILKACQKSEITMVYAFNHAAEVWWKPLENKVNRCKNLQVWRVPTQQSQNLVQLAGRSMQLQATIQEGNLMLSDNKTTIDIECVRWL